MAPLHDIGLQLQVLYLCGTAAFLWYVGWRRYRLDLFRQRLFALRDELFDIAADGDIRFNDYAYSGLRRLLNNTIRFGHRVNSAQVIAIGVFGSDAPEAVEQSYKDWLRSVENIENEQVRKKIHSIHERLHYEMVTKIVLTSLPMIVTVGVILGCVMLFGPLFWGAAGVVRLVAELGRRLRPLMALEEEFELAA